MFDPRQVREDFPIFRRLIHGHRLVYLDNAATSQKPRAVIDALVRYYENSNANIHRGIHQLAEEATEQYEYARALVASFIGAPAPSTIVFVRNATEGINFVAQTWARSNLQPGDEILVTESEHHSNLVPWQLAAAATGATVRAIPITDEGTLDLEAAHQMMSNRVKLVAAAQMSNVLGSIYPVRQLADLAHANGALILVDGAQSVPHLPVDVAELDCDFLAFSSHKMLGPTGVGALYARSEILATLEPMFGGGGMISDVSIERSTWALPPDRFEAGTPNIADVIAFGAAIEYLNSLGMANVRQHEMSVTNYALERLGSIPDFAIYGPRDVASRGGVVSFNYGDVHPHDVSTIVDEMGVAIRAGHHCCQPLMQRLGVAATARASFYVYNDEADVDVLVSALGRVKEILVGTSLDDLYREVILEHYRSPHNRGRISEPDVANRGRNPLCGDDIEISLTIADDKVTDVRFMGRGCSISQASASMLTDAVKGKTLGEARTIVEGFKSMMRGDAAGDIDLSDVEALGGVRKFPVRVKCAMLAWTTFEEGIDNYTAGRSS